MRYYTRDGHFSWNLVPYILLFLMLILTFAPLASTFAQEAPASSAVEYRDVPGMGSRTLSGSLPSSTYCWRDSC